MIYHNWNFILQTWILDNVICAVLIGNTIDNRTGDLVLGLKQLDNSDVDSHQSETGFGFSKDWTLTGLVPVLPPSIHTRVKYVWK